MYESDTGEPLPLWLGKKGKFALEFGIKLPFYYPDFGRAAITLKTEKETLGKNKELRKKELIESSFWEDKVGGVKYLIVGYGIFVVVREYGGRRVRC